MVLYVTTCYRRFVSITSSTAKRIITMEKAKPTTLKQWYTFSSSRGMFLPLIALMNFILRLFRTFLTPRTTKKNTSIVGAGKINHAKLAKKNTQICRLSVLFVKCKSKKNLGPPTSYGLSLAFHAFHFNTESSRMELCYV